EVDDLAVLRVEIERMAEGPAPSPVAGELGLVVAGQHPLALAAVADPPGLEGRLEEDARCLVVAAGRAGAGAGRRQCRRGERTEVAAAVRDAVRARSAEG